MRWHRGWPGRRDRSVAARRHPLGPAHVRTADAAARQRRPTRPGQASLRAGTEAPGRRSHSARWRPGRTGTAVRARRGAHPAACEGVQRGGVTGSDQPSRPGDRPGGADRRPPRAGHGQRRGERAGHGQRRGERAGRRAAAADRASAGRRAAPEGRSAAAPERPPAGPSPPSAAVSGVSAVSAAPGRGGRPPTAPDRRTPIPPKTGTRRSRSGPSSSPSASCWPRWRASSCCSLSTGSSSCSSSPPFSPRCSARRSAPWSGCGCGAAWRRASCSSSCLLAFGGLGYLFIHPLYTEAVKAGQQPAGRAGQGPGRQGQPGPADLPVPPAEDGGDRDPEDP